MTRTPPRSRRLPLWAFPLVALLLAFNFGSIYNVLSQMTAIVTMGDWAVWGWVNIEDPYSFEWVRWSPPAVWAMTELEPWALPFIIAANFASLLALPPRVALIALLAWPFWAAAMGVSFIPIIVAAGWRALDGSRTGALVYLAFAVLIPRPLMLPVLIVLLYRHSWVRWAFVAMALGVAAYALAVGQLDDWVVRLLEVPAAQPYNVSPSQLIGRWWVPIGVALAALLAWRGWYGLASLAISPYLFSSYLLFGLLDLRRASLQSRTAKPGRSWRSVSPFRWSGREPEA